MHSAIKIFIYIFYLLNCVYYVLLKRHNEKNHTRPRSGQVIRQMNNAKNVHGDMCMETCAWRHVINTDIIGDLIYSQKPEVLFTKHNYN